ncbi:MAG: GNAT family N-acetyltransferase [Acidimicrobiales bacterium]
MARDDRIRPTRKSDLDRLRAIERVSGEQFRQFGLDHVADAEPASVEELADYADAGRSWVVTGGPVTGGPDELVGFILVKKVDGDGHIEQVSVLPACQGRGLGRALIGQVQSWAAAHAMGRVTLTTYAHIPWNKPLYEHLGFHVLRVGEIGPGLAQIMEHEAAQGLDPELRVAMGRDI